MIAVAALLLQSEPLVVICSTRANTCGTVQQRVGADEAGCGTQVTFRDDKGGSIFIADVAQYEIVLPENTTVKQRNCLAKALTTVHTRPYSAPSGSKN